MGSFLRGAGDLNAGAGQAVDVEEEDTALGGGAELFACCVLGGDDGGGGLATSCFDLGREQ